MLSKQIVIKLMIKLELLLLLLTFILLIRMRLQTEVLLTLDILEILKTLFMMILKMLLQNCL